MEVHGRLHSYRIENCVALLPGADGSRAAIDKEQVEGDELAENHFKKMKN